MTKKIYVACGGAVATSTVAAEKIRELCKKNGIDANVEQVQISQLGGVADNADLIVTTARVTRDYNVPVIHGIAFISGIGLEKTEAAILDVLQN